MKYRRNFAPPTPRMRSINNNTLVEMDEKNCDLYIYSFFFFLSLYLYLSGQDMRSDV